MKLQMMGLLSVVFMMGACVHAPHHGAGGCSGGECKMKTQPKDDCKGGECDMNKKCADCQKAEASPSK